VISSLLVRLPLVFVRVLGQKSGVSPIGGDQADPHGEIGEEEDVMRARQDVPSHGNALGNCRLLKGY